GQIVDPHTHPPLLGEERAFCPLRKIRVIFDLRAGTVARACGLRTTRLSWADDSERTRASFDFFGFSVVSVKIKRPRALLALKAFGSVKPKRRPRRRWKHHRGLSPRGHEGAYCPRHRKRQTALWLARHSWSSRACTH